MPAIDHVVGAAITPSCNGFTIGQIGGTRGACPAHRSADGVHAVGADGRAPEINQQFVGHVQLAIEKRESLHTMLAAILGSEEIPKDLLRVEVSRSNWNFYIRLVIPPRYNSTVWKEIHAWDAQPHV